MHTLKRITLLAVFVAAFCLTTLGQASERIVYVHQKTGEPIKGKLVRADEHVVEVEVDGVVHILHLDNVTTIYIQSKAEAVSSPAVKAEAIADEGEAKAPTTVQSEPTPTLTASPSTAAPSSEKTVHVRGYYRKDGTYVRPHTRRPPRRRN